MNAAIRREAFSERLKSALAHAGYAIDSKREFHAEFNRRYAGRPLSLASVYRWIEADAYPTDDKLSIIAGMLGVSAAWLRHGIGHPGCAGD
jgi:hypothetical protein